MKKLMVLVLVVLIASTGIGQAQDSEKLKSTYPHAPKEAVAEDSTKKFLPIESQQAGPENPTKAYFYKRQRLENFQQLKEVIHPLNDPEASHLLESSASKDSVAAVLDIVGGLLVVGGFVYLFTAPGTPKTNSTYIPTPGPPGSQSGGLTINSSSYSLDEAPTWILGISGGIVVVVGLVFGEDAGQCRRDAVKRYNHVIESDQNLSMILLPHTNLPGLELTQRF